MYIACGNCETQEEDISCILSLDILEQLMDNEIVDLFKGEQDEQTIH